MKTIILPYKGKETDPAWAECLVKKPESFLEYVRLSFGPGEWNDHLFFGRIRIIPFQESA